MQGRDRMQGGGFGANDSSFREFIGDTIFVYLCNTGGEIWLGHSSHHHKKRVKEPRLFDAAYHCPCVDLRRVFILRATITKLAPCFWLCQV
jgi:hypothetical protein